MTLADYLQAHQISLRVFAKRARAGAAAIHQIARGSLRPGNALALRIEAATAGAVPALCSRCRQPLARNGARKKLHQHRRPRP